MNVIVTLLFGGNRLVQPGGGAETSQVQELQVIFHFIQFFVVVAMIAFLVLSIRHHNRRRCEAADDLLDELEQGEQSPGAPTKESEGDEWEKNPDWWKS